MYSQLIPILSLSPTRAPDDQLFQVELLLLSNQLPAINKQPLTFDQSLLQFSFTFQQRQFVPLHHLTMTDQDYIPPTWLDKSYLQHVLNTKYGSSDSLSILDYTVKVATKKGENYASEMFRIEIRTSGGDQLFMILKKPHAEKDRRGIVDAYDFFGKEIKFYTKYLPQLNDILKSVEEHEEFAPELIFCDEEREALILKDLRAEGFVAGDRFQRLCRESAKVFMRKLAKYHASTLILNQKLNGQLEKQIFDQFLVDGPFKVYFEAHPFALIDEVKSWGEEYESMIPKLERIAPSYLKLAHEAITSKRGFNVLAHGDLWSTNLLIKKTTGQKVDDVRMIDFQLNGWASMASDILNFAFRALNEEDYEAGLGYLIEIYHQHLDAVLKKLNYDKVPSLEDIHADIRDGFFHGELFAE